MGIVAPPLHSQDFTFTTIAGGSQGSARLVLSAQFHNPLASRWMLGNVFVADSKTISSRKISPSGADWIGTIWPGAPREA